MKLIPNFLKNHKEIVEWARSNEKLFKLRTSHKSILPIKSHFHALKLDTLWQDPIIMDMIFNYADWEPTVKDFWVFIQLNWYKPGDFIVPHQHVFGAMKTTHVITLTNSNVDGLCVEEEDPNIEPKLHRVIDKAGQKIVFDTAWHWVDPVINDRFSLIVAE